MAPPQVKAPYTAPQTYQLFTDTYLRTHRQRMDESLQMAMMELQNQKDLLAYYQKAEKNLIDYMEKVGTAGTGGGKLSDKQFERFFKVAQVEATRNNNLNNAMAKVNKMVQDEFIVPQAAIGDINLQADKAATNLTTGALRAAEKGAKAVGGYTPGTTGAMSAAILYYQQLQNESVRKGTDGSFNPNANAIAAKVADVFGVSTFQGGSGAAFIQNPQAMDNVKQKRKAELVAEQASATLTDAQLKDLYKKAGVTPAQVQSGKGPSATALEQEELFAKRLATLQKKQDELESKIFNSATAENIYNRQTEIYNNRYRQTAKSRRQSKAIEDAMRKLSPQQIYLMESMEAAAGSNLNPYFATNDDKGEVVQAKELMDAMINNKGKGRQLDVIKLASTLADGDDKKAHRILGLAIKGVITYAQEEDPTLPIAEAQSELKKSETLQEEVKKVVDEKEAAEEAKAELKVETPTAKTDNIPVPQELIDGLAVDGTMTPFDQAPKAFQDEQSLLDFFAQRAKLNPQGIAPERIREIVGEGALPSEVEAIQKISVPMTPEEQAEAAKLNTATLQPKEPVQLKAPPWYDKPATVTQGPNGEFIVVSPRYGNFTLDAQGNVIDGKVIRGSVAGHFGDLQKANK